MNKENVELNETNDLKEKNIKKTFICKKPFISKKLKENKIPKNSERKRSYYKKKKPKIKFIVSTINTEIKSNSIIQQDPKEKTHINCHKEQKEQKSQNQETINLGNDRLYDFVNLNKNNLISLNPLLDLNENNQNENTYNKNIKNLKFSVKNNINNKIGNPKDYLNQKNNNFIISQSQSNTEEEKIMKENLFNESLHINENFNKEISPKIFQSSTCYTSPINNFLNNSNDFLFFSKENFRENFKENLNENLIDNIISNNTIFSNDLLMKDEKNSFNSSINNSNGNCKKILDSDNSIEKKIEKISIENDYLDKKEIENNEINININYAKNEKKDFKGKMNVFDVSNFGKNEKNSKVNNEKKPKKNYYKIKKALLEMKRKEALEKEAKDNENEFNEKDIKAKEIEKKVFEIKEKNAEKKEKEKEINEKQSFLNPPSEFFFEIEQEKDFLKEKTPKKIKENSYSYNSGRWRYEEHERFIEAIFKFGNEWKKVQKFVATRSSSQARSHAQKFFSKIKKENLIKYGFNLPKNSIKTIYQFANKLSPEEYIKAIKTFNNITFDKKEKDEIYRKKLKKNIYSNSSENFNNEEISNKGNNKK